MTRDKWLDTVSDVEEKFNVQDSSIHPDEDLSIFQDFESKEGKLLLVSDSDVLPQLLDFIEFVGPEDVTMRFEYVVTPRFVKEKTLFTKRLGSNVKVEKLYDPNDLMRSFRTYREEGGEWVEMRA